MFLEDEQKQGLKIAVVIADSSGEPFTAIKDALHPSIWNNLTSSGVDVFYVSGKKSTFLKGLINNLSEGVRYSKLWPIQNLIDCILLSRYNKVLPPCNVKENLIEVEICEGLRTLGVKMLSAYNYLYRENYDYIFKTTLSSIVNEKVFLEFIHKLPRYSIVYGGTPVNFGLHPFASGSNTLLSKQALGLLFRDLARWNHGFLDDVAMGRIFEEITEITPIASLHIESIDELNQIPDLELKQTIHFRCKSRATPRNDVQIIQELRSRLRNLEGEPS
jgi:hypothetical protein